MKREPGFYWVRHEQRGWFVAEWHDDKTFYDTNGWKLEERSLDEVGDRILSPDEQADADHWADRPGEDN